MATKTAQADGFYTDDADNRVFVPEGDPIPKGVKLEEPTTAELASIPKLLAQQATEAFDAEVIARGETPDDEADEALRAALNEREDAEARAEADRLEAEAAAAEQA